MQALASLCVILALYACADDDASSDAASGDLTRCEVSSDCTVVAESCCGTCGAPTRGDALAINLARATTYRKNVCKDLGCPACAPLFIDPTLLATCRAQRCELVDLREHAASACAQDADCRVRTPDCCECGGDTSLGRLVGVSSESDYSALVCDPDSACPECAPIYPSEVTVRCNADHHCETRDLRLPVP